MAYPAVASVFGEDTYNGTSPVVTMPSGVQAGDLLLCFFASDGIPTISFPGGWTELFQTARGGDVKFGVWYRVSDGGEGASITVTLTVAEAVAYTIYRITGYSGTPEEANIAGDSTSPNPPSLTPTWGSLETLWFAGCGYDSNRTVSAYPTNYTDGRNDSHASSAGCGVGTARREITAVSEDPGVFTISVGDEWVACAIGVSPVTGWAGTVSGVANPAKVLGVAKADITKVCGVS